MSDHGKKSHHHYNPFIITFLSHLSLKAKSKFFLMSLKNYILIHNSCLNFIQNSFLKKTSPSVTRTKTNMKTRRMIATTTMMMIRMMMTMMIKTMMMMTTTIRMMMMMMMMKMKMVKVKRRSMQLMEMSHQHPKRSAIF